MNKKRIAGYKATEYIKDGMIVGLGTGSTAYYMLEKLGDLVQSGLSIKGLPTSDITREYAKKFNIPLVDINEIEKIDIAIDGVDEIDDHFNAIKGGGGALLREKIVASIANEVIWIMDDSKLVKKIGSFPLPIEVIPFGYEYILKQLLEFNPKLRVLDNNPFITDNRNYIIDLQLKKPLDIKNIINKLNSIVGVIENGLFINMCNRIIIGTDNGVQIKENHHSNK